MQSCNQVVTHVITQGNILQGLHIILLIIIRKKLRIRLLKPVTFDKFIWEKSQYTLKYHI